MKKSHILLLTVFLGLTLLLSACVPGPRVTGFPGISIKDEMAFVSYGNFVYGMNVSSGKVAWHYPDEASTQVVFYAQPLIVGDYLYVGDLANNFHKLDLKTGQQEWTFTEAKGYFIGQAAEDDGVIYAPSNDGKLYALDVDGKLLWTFETDRFIWAQPQISGQAVFVGSMDHFVYALTKNGGQIWAVEMAGAVVGSPLLSEDETTLYVGSLGSEMVALDTSDGSLIWSYPSDASVWGSPTLVGDTLYFGDTGGNLYALDSTDGQMIWQTEFTGAVVGGLTAIEDGFVLATEQGVVRAFNYDGSVKWEATLAGEIFQVPVANEDFLIVGTINGENLLYAFNLAGVQRWSTTPED